MAWRDNNSATLRIKSYNGSAWSQVGSGTLDTSGGTAQYPQLAVYNDQLFLAWVQVPTSSFLSVNRVQKFDGTSWSPTNDGVLTYSSGWPAYLAATSNALHIVWSDGIKNHSASYQESPATPAAPTGLKASSGNQKVSLSWDNAGSGLDYKIYQGSESGVYDPTPVATVSGTNSYTATGLTNGSTYYYAVTASNDIGESGHSNETSVKAGVINAVLTEGCSYLWTANSQEAIETCDANPLWVGTLTNYDNGEYQPRSTAEAVLKFDLPAVNAPVVSAQLKVYVPKKQVSSGANDATITVYDADPGWQPYNAGSGTSVAAPQPANLSTGKYSINTPPSWNSFDVNFLVKESMDNGRNSVALILQGTKTNSDSLASNLDLYYNKPGYEAVLELTLGEPSEPELAPQVSGLTWAPGGAAGTTKLTGVNGDPTLRYAIGAAGEYAQPVVGADASELGYTLSLDLEDDIAVTSGQHIYVVAVDGLGHIVEWSDAAIADDEINPGSNPQPELAPQVSGLTWAPGGAAGTTKLTGVNGDPTLRYTIGAAGEYAQPVVGANASELGYTLSLNLEEDVAVTSGQHIYVVAVDSLGHIVEWSDAAIADDEINPGSNPQPELAPQLGGLTWAPGSAAGTTKLTGVSGDPLLRYAVGAAGQYTQPVVGADARDLGYVKLKDLNVDIAVTSGQHIYVVSVDSRGGIIEWADVAIADADINPGSNPQPELVPQLSGLTWSPGEAAGTTKLTGVSGDPILRYTIGAAGQYTQPVVGADASNLGYSLSLDLNADVAVTSGQHIYVVAVDSLGHIVKWADAAIADTEINPGSNPQPEQELAPQLSGLTWSPGEAAGTTKLTGVSGDPILRFAIGAAGQYTQPVVGADASNLGYTLSLNLNVDIAVTSGQHIYVVAVDSLGHIVKWADAAVADPDIRTATPVYPYTPPASPSSQDESFAIKVNDGELQDQTATAKVDQSGGKKRTTVSIDGKKLSGRLANTTGAVVSIPVNNGSDTVIGELDAQTVKAMQSSKAVLRIETEHVVYTIPADQIDVSALSSQFGADINLSDIVIRVTIANVPDQEVVFLPQDGQQLQMIAPAVDFSITAVYQGREVKVDMFNAYVERMIAIPDGVDPGKITTGVVALADGSLLHVPTKVLQTDGKYYAVINSLTNSVYSVVYNVKTFEDIAKHWAQTSIEDMASRLVLSGGTNNQYMPDEAITRAEFAAIMVRGLGLHNAKQPAAFSDVTSSDWFHNAVAVAASYGLLQGYPDGTFRPNHSITRQEAMVIVAKAMDIAAMDTSITSDQRNDLLAVFKDAGQFGGWAKSAAALNIRYGVINGSGGTVRPLDQVTRAETAAIVQRLLKQAGLI